MGSMVIPQGQIAHLLVALLCCWLGLASHLHASLAPRVEAATPQMSSLVCWHGGALVVTSFSLEGGELRVRGSFYTDSNATLLLKHQFPTTIRLCDQHGREVASMQERLYLWDLLRGKEFVAASFHYTIRVPSDARFFTVELGYGGGPLQTKPLPITPLYRNKRHAIADLD
jgi:hypothetical protein